MKIVFIGTVASSIIGFRGPLIQRLLATGHEVYAFAINFTDDDKRVLESWGVFAVDFKLSRSGLNPLSDIKLIFWLKKKLQAIQPDIVFSYFSKPVIYGTLSARLAKVPKRVAMLEGLGFPFTDQPEGKTTKSKIIQIIQVFLYAIAFPFTTDLIFLNQDDQDELLIKYKLKSNQVHLISGIGLDFNCFPYVPVNISQLRFLFVGRLLKEKGIFDFLSAAKIVKEKYPHVEFLVLGSADDTSPNALSNADLQNYVDAGVIIYPGQVQNVLEYISLSSVFVLPSFREGFPRSSQEAMAVGRPILTTDVPGCRETVVNGENGFLVPAFDVNALVNRMVWFIKNVDDIQRMGLASRRMAEQRFDVNKANDQIIEIMGL